MSFAQSLQFIIISQEHLERGRKGEGGGGVGIYRESKKEQVKGRSGKIALYNLYLCLSGYT